MVLFVDLEHDVEPPESLLGLGLGLELENGQSSPPLHWSAVNNKRVLNVNVNVNVNVALRPLVGGRGGGKVQAVEEKERANPNKNAITEALGCYPIITSIASHIDLNTLDALSLTCRQIRANLLQFRTQLLASTLHCENEELKLDPEHTLRYRARAANWYFVDMSRETVGKAGDCARDMVDGCRRCGRVVCRNCSIKPPAPIMLRQRHRRICIGCSKASLSALIAPSSESQVLPFESTLNPETLRRATCTCPDRVWLCQSCGRGLYSADAEYEGIWKWRTRYLPSLGGLGVGIGEGNQGVPCGRGSDCIAAREVEQETDCDAEDAKDVTRAVSPPSSSGSISTSGIIGGTPGITGNGGPMGPGYARHEIEGIGGVMKKKLVRMVKVGACVPEFESERESGRFLVREVEGSVRSYCGWCYRIVRGVKDVLE